MTEALETFPVKENILTVQMILDDKQGSLGLELLNAGTSLDHQVADSDISSPGIALSGFTKRFVDSRIQVFGETEIAYLQSLADDEMIERLEKLLQHKIPAVFVTKGLKVSDVFLRLATNSGIPVISSNLSTKIFYRRFKPYLDAALAPKISTHGSLADVYGVGLLFVGQSGVGKSECVLDLVERGHRFVADDLIIVSRVGNDVLLGEGHALQGHHMEIRGLGVIDIRSLFGIRATRRQKRIEVVVKLEIWNENAKYSRTGLDPEEVELLGVHIPKVTIPVNPGKNITVISEVVAMNNLLKYSGIDSSAAFDLKIQKAMHPIKEYLEQDYE